MRNLWRRATASVEYGLTDQLTLRGETNYQWNRREEAFKNNYYGAQGLGDLLLGARYWLAKPDPSRWNFYIGTDVRFPTGDDDDRHKGAYKKAYILPGSGQWGVVPNAGFYRAFGDFAFMGSLGAVFSLNKNDAGYESANVYQAALGVSWIPIKLGQRQQALIGASLFATATCIPHRDRRDGVPVGNTGGKWRNIVPTVFFSPNGGKVTAYLSVPITVYANVHSLQCYEPYSVSGGLQFRF